MKRHLEDRIILKSPFRPQDADCIRAAQNKNKGVGSY
jgi:hypothetical protein